mgnify:CR=1 FL=1|tara:strand:- start:1700 stop:3172 length:1473 start_codon:yes stop_codon:yes gene_type:complete
MKNKLELRYLIQDKFFIYSLLVILMLNILFLIKTFGNNWASDDFPYIFCTKLFNLINDQNFFIYETDSSRFRPFFWFIVQFIPSKYLVWHSFVVLIYILSSILCFIVVKKITNDSKISFITSVLFTLNYSISLYSLSWGVFFGHIFNVFFGLINILIFISIISEKKFQIWKIATFLILNLLNFTITEGGIIYIFINVVILIFYNKEKIFKKTQFLFINFLPLIVFLSLSFANSGSFIPTLEDRLDKDRDLKYQKIFNPEGKNTIYFYRSTYAPRDVAGYTLRFVENLIGTFNISLLENNIRTIDKKDSVKKIIKKNFNILALFIFILFLIFFIYLLKQLKIKKNISEYYFFIALFVTVILIYNFIYFRKDINLAMAFSGSLLLAKVISDLLKMNKKFLSYFLISLYSLPTILSFLIGFNYYGDFNEYSNKKLMQKYNQNLNIEKDKNLFLKNDSNFKCFYFYHKYDDHEEELKFYKSKNLHTFFIKFNEY